jgi:hypothetical protein
MTTNRVYLQTEDSVLRKLIWFRQHRENEMLMGWYGLKEKNANLTHVFPKQIHNNDERIQTKFKYADAAKPVKCRIDHLSCHADGTIHLKKLATESKYIEREKHFQKIDENTHVFLAFVLLSDSPNKYTSEDGPAKNASVTISTKSNQIVQIRGMFSGVNFPLEQKVDETIMALEGRTAIFRKTFMFPSKTIKGIIWWYFENPPPEALNRPQGTIVSFCHPDSLEYRENKYKAYIFS